MELCQHCSMCIYAQLFRSLSHIISPWDNINLWRQGGRRQKCSISGNFCAITEMSFMLWKLREWKFKVWRIYKDREVTGTMPTNFVWSNDYLISFEQWITQSLLFNHLVNLVFLEKKLINVNKDKIVQKFFYFPEFIFNLQRLIMKK